MSDDGLRDVTLTLCNFSVPVGIKFEPSIVSIGDHCTKSEECSSCEGTRVDGGDRDRGDEIEQRPNSTKAKLDLYPWNSEKSLNSVEDVKNKQKSGEPEGHHRHRVEKSSREQMSMTRELNAEETHQAENLSEGIDG